MKENLCCWFNGHWRKSLHAQINEKQACVPIKFYYFGTQVLFPHISDQFVWFCLQMRKKSDNWSQRMTDGTHSVVDSHWKEPLFEDNPFAKEVWFIVRSAKKGSFFTLISVFVRLPADCLDTRSRHYSDIWMIPTQRRLTFFSHNYATNQNKGLIPDPEGCFHDGKVSFKWRLRCFWLWKEANDLFNISSLSSRVISGA